MRILYLTIKRKWFIWLLFQVKTEEYREIKPYYQSRLLGQKRYDAVCFINGYESNSPRATFTLKGISIGIGKNKWGAPATEEVIILGIGDLLSHEYTEAIL